MPSKSLTFCRWPGCNQLTNKGYCDQHLPLHEQQQREGNRKYEQQRGKVDHAVYNARWNKVRDAYIRLRPLCEACEAEGKITLAALVHHRQAVKDNGAIYDTDNLQSLCTEHHEKIHGKDRWRRK